jgi:hypothetical protein
MSEFKPTFNEEIAVEMLNGYAHTGESSWETMRFLGYTDESPRRLVVQDMDGEIYRFTNARPLKKEEPKQPEIKLYDVVWCNDRYNVVVFIEERIGNRIEDTTYKLFYPKLGVFTDGHKYEDLKPRPDKVAVAPAVWHGNSNHYIADCLYSSSDEAIKDMDKKFLKWPSRLCDFHIVDREVQS